MTPTLLLVTFAVYLATGFALVRAWLRRCEAGRERVWFERARVKAKG